MIHEEIRQNLLRAQCEVAALRVVAALRKLIALTARKGFDPNEPRLPAGEPGGGQWMPVEGDTGLLPGADPQDTPPGDEEAPATPTIGDDSERPQDAARRRVGPTGTPAQETRLAIATSQARDAVSRVMDVDPTWRGPTGVNSTIEGQIAHQENMARAAEERLAEINRDGLGGNGGPPLGRDSGAPRFSMPQAPYAIDAYRNNFAVPYGKDTIAIGTMDNTDRIIIGVNSSAPGYTAEDRAAANAMRDNLIVSDPDIMRSDNIGYKPNDALYHAEATALMRAAEMNGGTLYGRSLDIFVDRRPCDSCDDVLPLIARELGYPTVQFTDIYGARRTLRNGNWE